MIGPAYALILYFALFSSAAPTAQITENIVSDHVRVQVTAERAWLGREAVLDLERCWQFINRATGGKLPRRVAVAIDWSSVDSSNDPARGLVSVGMADPSAARDRRGFLVHHAAREMAEMALIEASKGGAARPEFRFLLQGMSEILAHEQNQTTRALTGAWAMCHLLDRMEPLSLDRPAGPQAVPGDLHDLQTAAAGITFLITAREQEGRSRLLKLFEELKKGSLEEALGSAFKMSPASLEKLWLERIRAYHLGDNTVGSEEDAPVLRLIRVTPDPAPAAAAVEVRLDIEDRAGDILPGGVFLHQGNAGRVLRARMVRRSSPIELAIDIPPEPRLAPGRREFQVTAIDEAGNIRSWNGSYTVR